MPLVPVDVLQDLAQILSDAPQEVPQIMLDDLPQVPPDVPQVPPDVPQVPPDVPQVPPDVLQVPPDVLQVLPDVPQEVPQDIPPELYGEWRL